MTINAYKAHGPLHKGLIIVLIDIHLPKNSIALKKICLSLNPWYRRLVALAEELISELRIPKKLNQANVLIYITCFNLFNIFSYHL